MSRAGAHTGDAGIKRRVRKMSEGADYFEGVREAHDSHIKNQRGALLSADPSWRIYRKISI